MVIFDPLHLDDDREESLSLIDLWTQLERHLSKDHTPSLDDRCLCGCAVCPLPSQKCFANCCRMGSYTRTRAPAPKTSRLCDRTAQGES
ncbi:hypothetical protein BC628DRAFT_1378546 [Trametes gibbosa]|nr:hypothetical protein BC628DRAFT_1378546 [Trametes gibbosa]